MNVNKELKNIEITNEIVILKSKRISEEGVLDSIKTYLNNIKDSIVRIVRGFRKEKKEFVASFLNNYDPKLEETRINSFIKNQNELFFNKDSNPKTLEKDIHLNEDITRLLLAENGAVVNAKYVANRIKYTNKVLQGISKYFHDKKITVTVLKGTIESILTELDKEKDVNYEKIEKLLGEVYNSVDIGLISNLKLNLDPMTRIPKAIISNKSFDYKSIDTDKSYQFNGSDGLIQYLVKLLYPKTTIFPVSIRLIDTGYVGEGYIAEVEDLKEVIKKLDDYTTELTKLFNELKEGYADILFDVSTELLEDINDLVNDSLYDDDARYEKDLPLLKELVEISINIKDSLSVDNAILSTLFELKDAFSIYVQTSLDYYKS